MVTPGMSRPDNSIDASLGVYSLAIVEKASSEIRPRGWAIFITGVIYRYNYVCNRTKYTCWGSCSIKRRNVTSRGRVSL